MYSRRRLLESDMSLPPLFPSHVLEKCRTGPIAMAAASKLKRCSAFCSVAAATLTGGRGHPALVANGPGRTHARYPPQPVFRIISAKPQPGRASRRRCDRPAVHQPSQYSSQLQLCFLLTHLYLACANAPPSTRAPLIELRLPTILFEHQPCPLLLRSIHCRDRLLFLYILPLSAYDAVVSLPQILRSFS